MNKSTISKQRSYLTDLYSTLAAKSHRLSTLWLMLLMLLLLPTSMVAQTDYDTSVTFSALEGNPVGYKGETYANLFDGKKEPNNFSKWCCAFDSNKGTYVIFEASKAGVPVGYTITTGNDNANFGCGGRNPLSWKLYGNNEGEEGEWVLIQAVENDTKLQDKNCTSYDFTCEGSTSYKYFKWEISAIHSGSTLQVGEFELKLNTCSHKQDDGSSAFGEVKTVETTCTEHGYTTKECSICHLIVKEYLNDELKKHTLTHHEAKDEVKEHWQCDVCHKYFCDANATQEVKYASLIYKGYAVFDESTGTLTFKYGTSPEGAYDLNVKKWEYPGWESQRKNIQKVVFDASFANARPTICDYWFNECEKLTDIEGIENLNTEKVTSMESMFRLCDALTSLDLTNFNTAKVTDMKLLFANCSALESLDLSMFNTENVTSMPSMFNGATNLKTLNVSNFNTEKVNNMGHMFANCPNLTSLDLSSFNTKGVEYVDNIFKNCSNLTTIYASENFAFGSGLKNGADMFLGCDKLKGFIEYNKNTDTDKNNSEFVNYKTGYFTKLVGKNGEEKIGAVGETLTAESLALDDDKDFVAYEPFTATTATYNRTMKKGTTWATLCLPFEVSLAGKNFRAFELLSADEATNTVELEEIETSIAAGTPVIIKMNEGQTKLNFSVADKEIAHEVVSAADGNYQLQGIYTQKVFDKEADNNCYIVKGNKLMNPAKLLEKTNNKTIGSKPFRAYMIDNSSAPSAGAKMFSIGFDDDSTTAIDSLNTIANDNAEYYDLQGKRLNEPQKGINIVKRGNKTMKVIIK